MPSPTLMAKRWPFCECASRGAMADAPRRFPAPWRAEPIPGGYVVRDANGQALTYIYSRESEAEATIAVRSSALSLSCGASHAIR
jgi:hypothetical protein